MMKRSHRSLQEITLDSLELPSGEKATISLQAPAAFLIVFDPVSAHGAIRRRQGRADARAPDAHGRCSTEQQRRPDTSDDPAGSAAHSVRKPDGCAHAAELSGSPAIAASRPCWQRRRPFLTAKRLLTNQTFRDLYRTDTLDVDAAAEDHQPDLPVHGSEGLDRTLRPGRRPRRLRSRECAFSRAA